MIFTDANGTKIEAGQTLANVNFPTYKVKVKLNGKNLVLEYPDDSYPNPVPLKEFFTNRIRSAEDSSIYQLGGWEITRK